MVLIIMGGELWKVCHGWWVKGGESWVVEGVVNSFLNIVKQTVRVGCDEAGDNLKGVDDDKDSVDGMLKPMEPG